MCLKNQTHKPSFGPGLILTKNVGIKYKNVRDSYIKVERFIRLFCSIHIYQYLILLKYQILRNPVYNSDHWQAGGLVSRREDAVQQQDVSHYPPERGIDGPNTQFVGAS